MKLTTEFTSRANVWQKIAEQNLSVATGAMADAILSLARVKVPELSHKLKQTGNVSGKGFKREVVFDTPYAAYQERGMRADGTHVVRNYTKAGSQAHYLETSGDQVVKEGIKKFL